jgi:hypothetical protein
VSRVHHRPVLAAVAVAAVLAGLAACERADAEPQAALEPPAAASLAARGPAPPVDPPALAAVRSEPVHGLTGPGGQPFEVAIRDAARAGHDRPIGRQTFQISLRAGAIANYPCASCHQPGRPPARPERAEDAHRNVLPRHPERGGSACTTCHAADAVDQLVLIDGERVALGHAYRLCGQCHYPQVDAWAAGVHGKRLDGWRGRRVLMGCADCHDPHRPGVEPREPFPGPQIRQTRGRSP